MHELPVTESILKIALKHAQKSNAARIMRLNVVIGQLASIVDDSVIFYWDIISKDTPAEGAEIVFTRIPASIHCTKCNHNFELNKNKYSCPECNSAEVEIVTGREFFLESIEIE